MPDERLRILVIDDDGDLTASVAAVLSSSGYEVLTATTGEQGLELAFTDHPHLILLDVSMPGMDGHQVCRELQFGYTKDIPVVFLTARTELVHMMEANRSGASAYVTKPFRNEHLLRTISDVLRDSSVYHDDITGLPTLANVQVEVQRMLFDHGQLGVIYVNVGGVQALEQLQGFEVVDDVYRVVGQGLQEARGELIRGEDFVSISSLGDAFLIILSPSRHTGFISEEDLLMIKQRLEKDLLDAPRERAEEPPARQGRPLRRLVAAHAVAQDPLQTRAARRHRARHSVNRGGARRDPLPPSRGVGVGHIRGAPDLRVPADRQPQELHGDRLRTAVTRTSRERVAPSGRALRHRTQRRPRHGAGQSSAGARRRGPARSCRMAACASSTRSR